MTHTPLPAFSAYSGSRTPKLLLVGEAFGGHDASLRRPFVGEAGKELFLILGEAMPEASPDLHYEITSQFRYGHAWIRKREDWLEATGIGMTNVLNFQPPGGKIEHLCGSKTEVGKDYEFPPISHGKYLRREYLGELDRLGEEISRVHPNLIVALGNTACWAVLRATNISAIRGSITESVVPRGIKTLATYHPAAVMRMWSWRPIVVADMMKAGREMASPVHTRPRRTVVVNPSISEVVAWTEAVLRDPPELLSCDIETGAGQIKCVGFARSISESLVIPFVDLAHADGSYWPCLADELKAWECVRMLLESGIPILGQNFIYDLQYLTRVGIRPKACLEDTMLLSHAMYPEMKKGLGFLGSIHTNEASWKLMARRRAKDSKSEKADE